MTVLEHGTVYVVGAGPGDPALLTLRGADLLARAGAVVHDGDMSAAVLTRCGEGAHRVAVDPPVGRPVAEVLLELAVRHAVVVRLVRGDPWLAPAVAGELAALTRAGASFHVVPGVPAELAAPLCAGIPLTTSAAAGLVLVVRTAPAEAAGDSAVEPERLGAMLATAAPNGVGDAVARLRRIGAPASAPAAVVWSAATPRQVTETGMLGEFDGPRTPSHGGEPAVVVTGDGVLHERLAWFETRPLFGRRIVVTRPRAQAGGFVAVLEELGAEVVPFPTIRIQPVPDPEPLRRATREVQRFDWVVFTSVNGVAEFWKTLRETGRDSRALGGVSICAIGPATAAALLREGVRADLLPERFVAESVVDALAGAADLSGASILLPRAELARAVLPEALRARGASVVEVVAYRTVSDTAAADDIRRRLAADTIDVITFTASSTVENFVDLVGCELGGAEVASIGPITSSTARRLGLPVHLEAAEYTVPGLVRALVEHYSRDR
jgi:uroporphyrinogen III methyltransferase / synthase